MVRTKIAPKSRRFLPRRPKRPPTGLNVFVKEFFQKHKMISACVGIREADKEWKLLSEEQKKLFNEKAKNLKGTYEKDMKMWRKKKNILKRPRNSFAEFVKRTANDNQGLPFADIGRLAKQKWNELDAMAKIVYKLDYIKRRATYDGMIMDLANKTTTIDHYIEDEDENENAK